MNCDIELDHVTWLHSLAGRGTRNCVIECGGSVDHPCVAGSSGIVCAVAQCTLYKQEKTVSGIARLKSNVKLPEGSCRQCPDIIPTHNTVSRGPSAIGRNERSSRWDWNLQVNV